jgi:hypothetical protein
VVNKHNGSIGLISQLGIGTTFRIELPRVITAPSEEGCDVSAIEPEIPALA